MYKVKSSCSIYLVFGRKLKIPVNPQEIEIKYPTSHKEYDVLGLGKVVVPRKPGLRTVSWESFFPASFSDSYVNSGVISPDALTDRLQKAMQTKQVGRLIITRSELFDTNIQCIISDFSLKDKGGEPGEVYYSIELQEYKSFAPKVVSIITTETGKVEAAAEEQRPVETPVLRVGASVIANGKYWYDSYGSKPYGTANNLSTTVTRIAEGNPYPVHIGSFGWLSADQLQITG